MSTIPKIECETLEDDNLTEVDHHLATSVDHFNPNDPACYAGKYFLSDDEKLRLNIE